MCYTRRHGRRKRTVALCRAVSEWRPGNHRQCQCGEMGKKVLVYSLTPPSRGLALEHRGLGAFRELFSYQAASAKRERRVQRKSRRINPGIEFACRSAVDIMQYVFDDGLAELAAVGGTAHVRGSCFALVKDGFEGMANVRNGSGRAADREWADSEGTQPTSRRTRTVRTWQRSAVVCVMASQDLTACMEATWEA